MSKKWWALFCAAFLIGAMLGCVYGATAFPRIITETEYITETQYIDRVEYVDRVGYIERIEYVDRYIYTETPEPEVEYYSLGRFEITAYCSCERCCGKWGENRPKDENGNDIVYTATGAIAKPNHTIAVDPSVIPYGTQVVINGVTYTAEDTGGGIKGKRIDIYFDSHAAALEWGRRTVEVFVSK